MKERLFTEYNIIVILFIFFNAVIYKDRSLFYLGLIILFYKFNNYDKSISNCGKLINVYPLKGFCYKGMLLNNLKDYENSLDCLLKAEEILLNDNEDDIVNKMQSAEIIYFYICDTYQKLGYLDKLKEYENKAEKYQIECLTEIQMQNYR